MAILIFSHGRYRLNADTDILPNTDINTDKVMAETDMVKTDTDISLLAKNISQQKYRSISIG